MSTLPKGWISTKVKNLAGTSGLFVDGDWVESKDQDPNGAIRLLQLADIGDGVFLDKSDRWINEEAFTRLRCTELESGDVLIARMPDPLGRACLMPSLQQRCVTVVDVAALRVDPQVADNRWVMHTVNAPQLRAEISAQASGTTRKRISRGNFGGLQIPLPPASEQKRIADKLDTVLTRVDVVNNRLARVAPILKRFRQSVLAAATSGRLTEDWRASRGLKRGAETTLQEICTADRVITYGVVKLGDDTPGGTPCLRTSNVRWLRFELEGMKLIDPDLSAEYGRTVLRGGEVLVNVRGTLGGVAVATDAMEGWNVSREVAVVPVDAAQASSAYIALWIASDECQRWLSGVSKGVAYTGINIEDLRTLPLTLPLMEEQIEIVRRVKTLFAFADRLEVRLQTAQRATERLTPALLAKAFRGELVPQDSNDEPASELLNRLAATAPASAPKRGRRKTADADA